MICLVVLRQKYSEHDNTVLYAAQSIMSQLWTATQV
jgi:hypothetical protein